MRIVILTQWFEPEPAFKGLSFAKALQKAGHDVQVLTGFPNYPGGKLYPGYRVKLWQRETLDGIPVVRVALYPSHDRSSIGRVLNYVSFGVSAALLGPFLVRKADVLYVYHPPATIGLPAIALRLLRGLRIVYDIQDLWPDTLASTGMVSNRLVLSIVGLWCRVVYAFARRVVVLSNGFKSRLVERRVPPEKITVIRNWCDFVPSAVECDSDSALFPGEFLVLFAGNMGAAQGLDSVLDAARLTAKDLPQVRFAFVGSGVESKALQKKTKELCLRNVSFLGRRPRGEMGSLFARADALLVHLRDDPLFQITIPSKTQAYLAAGKPILMGVRGDAAELVNEARAGFLFEPENPTSLLSALQHLIQMTDEERRQMGMAGRLYYGENLSFERGLAMFEKEFHLAICRPDGCATPSTHEASV